MFLVSIFSPCWFAGLFFFLVLCWAACYPLYRGSMSVPRGQGLSSLPRRNVVKVAAAASVEECCLAVGEVVGHESVLSASRMNGAVVVFLNSVDKVDEVVEHGIVIGGDLVSVLPLSLPAKRVTLSNVPPFVNDESFISLWRIGISDHKDPKDHRGSPLLKHIVSFRRFAYMIIPDDDELDMELNFRIDNFEHVIFVSTVKSKCFGCGRTGHLIGNCPDKVSDREANAVNGTTKGDGGGDGGADMVEEVLPGPSSAVAAAAAGVPGESVVASTSLHCEHSETIHTATLSEASVEEVPSVAPVSEDKRDEPIERENSPVTLKEAGGMDGVEKDIYFKVPSNKRKIIDKMVDAKISKRSEVQEGFYLFGGLFFSFLL
ncbi:uncharacterized protein LOC114552333 [Perca flavescens]|uniref:uncharacterized protein LOC114552333 n=1 Tax=Perca flavescens TaxID=8167 RepID=UPI00106EF8B7|nr:uncharacterized protein LOC114552333 [Perca flavescens]